MTYRLPPLAGLRAFEAAARHMSFKRAADELCVTAGAVSQHVRTLEEALGVELFRRLARSIELTVAGRKYLPSVSAAFEMISEATETSAPALRGWKLRVGIVPELRKLNLAAVNSLLSRKAHEQVIGFGMPDEPAQVAEGRVHALLRLSDKSCGGLHIERIALRNGAERVRAVLVTRPGLAGCRQHRTLVKMLHGGR